MNQKERKEIEKFFRENCDLRDAIDWLNKVIKRNGLERYNYINRISNSSDKQEKGLYYCIKAYYMTLPFTRWLRAERPSRRNTDLREEVVFNPHDGTWEEIGGGTVYGATELDIYGRQKTAKASTSDPPQRTRKKASSKKVLRRKSKRVSKKKKPVQKRKSKKRSVQNKKNNYKKNLKKKN